MAQSSPELCAIPLTSLSAYSCLPWPPSPEGWGLAGLCPPPQPHMTLVIRVFAEATGCDRSRRSGTSRSTAPSVSGFHQEAQARAAAHQREERLVSPADRTITTVPGRLHHLVKGSPYSLEMFLGCLDNIRPVIKVNDDPDYDSDSPAQVLPTPPPLQAPPKLTQLLSDSAVRDHHLS